MSKKSIRVIIFLMSIAFIGIILLQIYFIKQSYAQKAQIFDQTISSILADVSKEVDKKVALDFISSRIEDGPKRVVLLNKSNKKASKKSKGTSSTVVINSEDEFELPPEPTELEDAMESYQADLAWMKEEELQKQEEIKRAFAERKRLNHKGINHRIDSLNKLSRKISLELSSGKINVDVPALEAKIDSIRIFNFQFENPEFVINIDSDINEYKYYANVGHPKSKRISVSSNHTMTPPPLPPYPLEVKKFFEKSEKNETKVFEELARDYKISKLSIKDRINPKEIDSIIKREFQNRSLSVNYFMKLQNYRDKEIYFLTSNFPNQINSNPFSTVLFSDTPGAEQALLQLYFPDKDKSLIATMASTIGSSILLLLVILFCFVYTIRSILKQKKLSELKNDFINNMTHEFKTPVSTILLASEALKDREMVKDENRLVKYAGIIYDENLRLSEHVDRVLNMARMDRGDVKLMLNAVSMHELLDSVLESIQMQVDSKHQKLTLNLEAEHDLVYVDSFHLKNIINNLLDNAMKYSMENSEIVVSTSDANGGLVFSVKDNGIGMKKEQIKKIFEPFYRVPTGNLHNVKGFGIGLHYVSTLVKQMNGKINVKSDFGKGTEFNVFLPSKFIYE